MVVILFNDHDFNIPSTCKPQYNLPQNCSISNIFFDNVISCNCTVFRQDYSYVVLLI